MSADAQADSRPPELDRPDPILEAPLPGDAAARIDADVVIGEPAGPAAAAPPGDAPPQPVVELPPALTHDSAVVELPAALTHDSAVVELPAALTHDSAVVEPPDPTQVASIVEEPAPPDAAVEVHQSEVPGTTSAPRAARHWVTEQLAGRLAPDALFNVQVLVSEVVTNALRHGGVTGDEGVKVGLSLLERTLRVEVQDRGPGFRAPEPPQPRDDGGGNGLVLVQRLSSRWGVIDDGGALVWFELDLPEP